MVTNSLAGCLVWLLAWTWSFVGEAPLFSLCAILTLAGVGILCWLPDRKQRLGKIRGVILIGMYAVLLLVFFIGDSYGLDLENFEKYPSWYKVLTLVLLLPGPIFYGIKIWHDLRFSEESQKVLKCHC
jgi:hypothetical protein